MNIWRTYVIHFLVFTFCKRVTSSIANQSANSLNYAQERQNIDDVSSFTSSTDRRNPPFRKSESISNKETIERDNRNDKQIVSRRNNLDRFYDIVPPKFTTRLDNFWAKNPYDNYIKRNESLRKIDHSMTWPAWSTSKKEIYNNRNRKNRKHGADPFEDYLGLDSKLHDLMSDRKYIHEHEGFFFPVHVPNTHHHEKEDHILIPLLLLILIPLLLFAIIIPLNANLLSTLFLIMQNNGATATAAQLATGRRKKRHLYTEHHPIIEERVVEMLIVIDKVIDEIENNNYF